MTIKKVLIVDDDSNAVNLLTRMLTAHGYDAQGTIDPFEGYRLAVENSYDLILLDIMMPNWSGFALCRELRLVEALQETPIYFVSAYSAVDVKVNAEDVGANGLIFKPVRSQKIFELLNSMQLNPSEQHLETSA